MKLTFVGNARNLNDEEIKELLNNWHLNPTNRRQLAEELKERGNMYYKLDFIDILYVVLRSINYNTEDGMPNNLPQLMDIARYIQVKYNEFLGVDSE